jgi:hypothetical protein
MCAAFNSCPIAFQLPRIGGLQVAVFYDVPSFLILAEGISSYSHLKRNNAKRGQTTPTPSIH